MEATERDEGIHAEMGRARVLPTPLQAWGSLGYHLVVVQRGDYSPSRSPFPAPRYGLLGPNRVIYIDLVP